MSRTMGSSVPWPDRFGGQMSVWLWRCGASRTMGSSVPWTDRFGGQMSVWLWRCGASRTMRWSGQIRTREHESRHGGISSLQELLALVVVHQYPEPQFAYARLASGYMRKGLFNTELHRDTQRSTEGKIKIGNSQHRGSGTRRCMVDCDGEHRCHFAHCHIGQH